MYILSEVYEGIIYRDGVRLSNEEGRAAARTLFTHILTRARKRELKVLRKQEFKENSMSDDILQELRMLRKDLEKYIELVKDHEALCRQKEALVSNIDGLKKNTPKLIGKNTHLKYIEEKEQELSALDSKIFYVNQEVEKIKGSTIDSLTDEDIDRISKLVGQTDDRFNFSDLFEEFTAIVTYLKELEPDRASYRKACLFVFYFAYNRSDWIRPDKLPDLPDIDDIRIYIKAEGIAKTIMSELACALTIVSLYKVLVARLSAKNADTLENVHESLNSIVGVNDALDFVESKLKNLCSQEPLVRAEAESLMQMMYDVGRF